MHGHLLLESWEIGKVNLSYFSGVATETGEVFIVANDDLLVFGNPHIHLKHVAAEIYCLLKRMDCIFGRVPTASAVGDEMV